MKLELSSHREVIFKKAILKYYNSQENTCTGVSCLMKLHGRGLNFIEKRLTSLAYFLETFFVLF